MNNFSEGPLIPFCGAPITCNRVNHPTHHVGTSKNRDHRERERAIHTMEESKSSAVVVGGSGGQEMNEQQIIGAYRGMLGDVNQMRRKISELEQEVSEHQ